jgi:hypothetical protein
MIQLEYKFSDEETVQMISENPYFQYFCGMKGYRSNRPFDPSLMVHFRKRFSAEIIGEINEMIIQGARERKNGRRKGSGDRDDGSGTRKELNASYCASPAKESTGGTEPAACSNAGTLIVDATCAPSNIRYPQDTTLLNQAREQTERIIDELHKQREGHRRPRTYVRIAKRKFISFSKKRKKSAKDIHGMIGSELRYLKRNLGIITSLLALCLPLPEKFRALLDVVRALYEQQRQMYEHRTRRVADRIVSLFQPWLRPIVRGKARSPVEFGVKLDVSVVNGFTRLEHYSFSAYNEGSLLIGEIERYREREGRYPSRVLADKLYRNRANLVFCKEHGIRLSGPALGRPPKLADPIRKREEYEDGRDRIEVERRFSLAKRRYGLGLLYTRLQETTTSTVALSILLMNLNKVYLFAKLRVLDLLFKFRVCALVEAVQ